VERSEAEPKEESERNGKVSGTKPRRKESNKAWTSPPLRHMEYIKHLIYKAKRFRVCRIAAPDPLAFHGQYFGHSSL
jgi:hypothetical protein